MQLIVPYRQSCVWTVSLPSSSLTYVLITTGMPCLKTLQLYSTQNALMVYSEIIAAYAEVHSNHTTAMCRQKVEFFNV